MSDPILERFIANLALPDPELDLAAGALLIAKQEYPELDVERYLARLDALAEDVRGRLAGEPHPPAVAGELNHYLFDVRGFRGNHRHYYDPRNSFLNEVLDRRLGIPITLSVVYLELGWRLGLAVRGISFPGHFLVALAEQSHTRVLDPYSAGAELDEQALLGRLRGVYGDIPVESGDLARLLAPASKRVILLRMLRNLKSIYVAGNAYERALWCINWMLEIDPGDASEIRDRGFVLYRLDCHDAARRDLARYLEMAPEAGDAADVRRLAGELEGARSRLN